MRELMQKIAGYLPEELRSTWVLEVFVVILIALLIAFVAQLIIKRLSASSRSTPTPWDDALVHAIGKPLHLLIWLLGITFAADIISRQTEAALFAATGPIRDVGVIALFAWFLIRFVKEFENALIHDREQNGQQTDRGTVHAMGKLVRTAILITAVLVVLQTLGFSISGVLAFGGIGGIAIGFAAKDLLANFFGGLMIYLDRPFTVGDWIRSPDREIEGVVEDIGWRLTRIRTFDKRPLYLPNSIFTTIAVENPSRMTNRRIYETIGIRYADIDQMNAIVADVKKMLTAHPEIDTQQTMIVNFNTFESSSVDFFIYTFTKTTNWIHYHEVKQDVLLQVSRIIAEHNAEIAFPTQTIHLKSETVSA